MDETTKGGTGTRVDEVTSGPRSSQHSGRTSAEPKTGKTGGSQSNVNGPSLRPTSELSPGQTAGDATEEWESEQKNTTTEMVIIADLGSVPVEKDPCGSNPCGNSGKCKSDPPGYICTCMKGWAGINCQGEHRTIRVGLRPCWFIYMRTL